MSNYDLLSFFQNYLAVTQFYKSMCNSLKTNKQTNIPLKTKSLRWKNKCLYLWVKKIFLSLHLWNRYILDTTALDMIILPGFLFMIVNHKLRNQEQRGK